MKFVITSTIALFLSLASLANDKIIDARSLAENRLNTERLVLSKSSEAYCIFSRQDESGFVIVKTERGMTPRIVAFSEECSWDEAAMPPAVLEWLHHLEVANTPAISEARSLSPQSKTDVLPLLTCHWHQNSPYNDLAPVITDGQVKTVAGCVAIAAAQVTYYWRQYNPESTMKDTPVYTYGGAPITYVVPKGSPNNWDWILDVYDSNSPLESRAAVAQLCYVLGTSSYLNYASSTGGSIHEAGNAMYSQYRLLSTYISRSDSLDDWEGMLYNELANGRPVVCSGSGQGGHAFVLDGYDSQTGLYHFNFGWGGSGDGYYPADESPEAMGGYYQGQAVLVNIHPQSLTSIPDTKVSPKSYGIYNMMGHRLSRPPHHGPYIIVDAHGAKKYK